MQFIESINVICFPSVAKLKLFLKSAQSARSNLESESMSEDLTQREGGGNNTWSKTGEHDGPNFSTLLF